MFWIVAIAIIGLLFSFVFFLKKEKSALIISSLVSLVGIIILASTIYIVSQLLSVGYIRYTDLLLNDEDLLFNLWLLIFTIFVTCLSYKLWKDKLFYEKYKLTFLFLTWGAILTIILSIVIFLIVAPFAKGDGFIFLVPLTILLLGAIITFVFLVIGFVIDKLKSKK